MSQPVDKNGLKVNIGDRFNVRVSPSANSTDIIDFTLEGKTMLSFPVDVSVKKETEIIEQSLIGIPTPLKFLGKSQIMGDMNDITTPNGILWYASKCLGGVVYKAENKEALITIETDDSYIIDITRDTALTGQTTEVKIKRVGKTDITINITAGMTVKEFIDSVNLIDGFTAILHIGEGTEVFNPITGKDIYASHIIQRLFCGALSDTYRKGIAKYVYIIVPKRGNPQYFNMLLDGQVGGISYQYIGCRLLKLGMNYQNSALTMVSSSIWASLMAEFVGAPSQAIVDNPKVTYSQTNGRTEAWVCGVRASAIASLNNNFELQVEPQWNISNEAYEIPNMRYSDTYDFEAMFNEQSKTIFEEYVNKNKNISTILGTKTYLDGKEYKLIKYAKTLLGQPQYPTIASGVIKLTAGGFTSIANTYDPYTSAMIITGDVEIDITYTEDEIKKDFSGYME